MQSTSRATPTSRTTFRASSSVSFRICSQRRTRPNEQLALQISGRSSADIMYAPLASRRADMMLMMRQKRLSPKPRPFYCHETSVIVSISGIVGCARRTHDHIMQDTRATRVILVGGMSCCHFCPHNGGSDVVHSERGYPPSASAKRERDLRTRQLKNMNSAFAAI